MSEQYAMTVNKGNIVVTLNIAHRMEESTDDMTATDTANSQKKATNLNMNITELTSCFKSEQSKHCSHS